MTSDEITKLIQGNGLTLHGDIEHFAALVRNDVFNKHNHLWLRRINEAVKAEREACAKLLEGGSFLHDQSPAKLLADEAAKAIRARSKV
jgi:hypothetical protein